MNHFAYLVDEEFTKTAATIGELVGRATNGGLTRVAKVPLAAEVLAPRFRRVQKLAHDYPAEVILLKVASARRGRFGMTKAAADVVAEVETDPLASDPEKDAAFERLFAEAVRHDVDNLKLASDAAALVGRAMVKEALGGLMARGVGNFLRSLGKHDLASAAEAGVARAGGKAVGGLARGVEKVAPKAATKMRGYGAKLLGQANEAEAIPRATAMRESTQVGERVLSDFTAPTQKIDMATVPRKHKTSMGGQSKKKSGVVPAALGGVAAGILAGRLREHQKNA